MNWDLLQILIAQAAQETPTGPPLPTWGWITICGALVTAVTTLAGLYKKARDAEVKAINSKVELAQTLNTNTAELLERAIVAFTTSKIATDQIVDKIEDLTRAIDELRSGRPRRKLTTGKEGD